MTIRGVRYGMIHDETACIGCTACMDACREVNQVPAGVARLQILRSGPVGEYPAQEYRFFRKSCQHCDNAPACTSARPAPPTSERRMASSTSTPTSASAVAIAWPPAPIRCASSTRSPGLLTSATSAARPIWRRASNRLCGSLPDQGAGVRQSGRSQQPYRQTAGAGDHLSLQAVPRYFAQDVPGAEREVKS